MLYPSLNEFSDLARTYRRVVLYREIAGDLVTPIGLLGNFADEPHLFLLESANLDRSFSRYTFFGVRPRRVITFRDGTLTVESAEGIVQIVESNPIDYLISQLSAENSAKSPAMGGFCGGYVGFIGYDIANYMGMLRTKIREDRKTSSWLFSRLMNSTCSTITGESFTLPAPCSPARILLLLTARQRRALSGWLRKSSPRLSRPRRRDRGWNGRRSSMNHPSSKQYAFLKMTS